MGIVMDKRDADHRISVVDLGFQRVDKGPSVEMAIANPNLSDMINVISSSC